MECVKYHIVRSLFLLTRTFKLAVLLSSGQSSHKHSDLIFRVGINGPKQGKEKFNLENSTGNNPLIIC